MSMADSVRNVRLFVYGSLKHGFSNHEAHCKGLVRFCPAWVEGRIFRLSCGFPALVLPEGAVLAKGSWNPAKDLELQYLMNAGDPYSRKRRLFPCRASEKWRRIKGELQIYRDPMLLHSIDALEEYAPGLPSLYERVLTFVHTSPFGVITAWLYVAGENAGKMDALEVDEWQEGTMI
ncbi:MAG: gamma-glutamylcyclotransferase [Deltaproteobacteria bacterium]|nr:gamma-glutamylcyclotransferase [Deltaproteobacteria bacterium]